MRINYGEAHYALVEQLGFYGKEMVRLDRAGSEDVIDKAVTYVSNLPARFFKEGEIGDKIYSIVYRFA